MKPLFCSLCVFFVAQTIEVQAQNYQDYKLNLGHIYGLPGELLDADGIDTTDIQHIRSLVDTSATHISRLACMFLAERGVTDIIPKIKSYYYATLNEVPGDIDYLTALFLLRDPEVNQLLYGFIDRIRPYIKNNSNAVSARSDLFQALEFLVVLGDYSRFPLVDSLYQDFNEIENGGGLNMLAAYGLKAEYRPRVFDLLKAYINHPKREFRIYTLLNLRNFRDFPETQTLYRNTVLNDTLDVVKDEAVRNLYGFYKDPVLVSLIEQVATTTTSVTIFRDMVSWLVHVYRTPDALAAMLRIRDSVTRSDFQSYASHRIEFYTPPQPRENVPTKALLDSLISYTRQVAALGWVKDKKEEKEDEKDEDKDDTIVQKLVKRLEKARKELAARDSSKAREEIEKFQKKVKKLREESLAAEQKQKPEKIMLTEEGYKFLYYDAKYIVERLPRKK